MSVGLSIESEICHLHIYICYLFSLLEHKYVSQEETGIHTLPDVTTLGEEKGWMLAELPDNQLGGCHSQ